MSSTDTDRLVEDEFTRLVEEGRIHADAYTQQAVFDAEMTRLFRRMWIYLAHESEIEERGDYVTRMIGIEPVIVTRSQDDEVHALSNRCIHRGATVCQANRGTSNVFRCQYHGWTYGSDGSVLGVPFPKGYGAELEGIKARSLNRVETSIYRGFVFGRMEPGPETLIEHLGEAREYIDGFVDAAPTKRVKIHPHPTRYRYQGNWKFSPENGNDGYHPTFVHGGFQKAMERRTGVERNPFQRDEGGGPKIDLGNGHGVSSLAEARHKHNRAEAANDSYYDRAVHSPGGAALVQHLEETLGKERAIQLLEPSNAYNLCIFPNLLLIQSQIRVVQPVAPDLTYVAAYASEWPDEPEEINQLRMRLQEGFWGPAGMGVPDDIEMFERVQRGLAAHSPEWLIIRRGLEREEQEGARIRGVGSDETTLRAFHNEWRRRMALFAGDRS